jgi:hypothetical protein
MDCTNSTEIDDVGLLEPQKWQEHGLDFDEKQRGKNATTLSIADARSAASNSISSSEPAFDSGFTADDCIFVFAGTVATAGLASLEKDISVTTKDCSARNL